MYFLAGQSDLRRSYLWNVMLHSVLELDSTHCLTYCLCVTDVSLHTVYLRNPVQVPQIYWLHIVFQTLLMWHSSWPPHTLSQDIASVPQILDSAKCYRHSSYTRGIDYTEYLRTHYVPRISTPYRVSSAHSSHQSQEQEAGGTKDISPGEGGGPPLLRWIVQNLRLWMLPFRYNSISSHTHTNAYHNAQQYSYFFPTLTS